MTDPTITYWRKRAKKAEDEVRALRDQLEEARLATIEARNPGIDMDEVRRSRANDQPPIGLMQSLWPKKAGIDTVDLADLDDPKDIATAEAQIMSKWWKCIRDRLNPDK
jgi:hypothetical protein